MTPQTAARAHLEKAQQHHEAAQLTFDLDLFDAAASSAVVSGINSKDAICLSLTGKTGKTDNHARAVDELRKAGAQGAKIAPTFSRLLDLKNKAQYQARPVTRSQAENSVTWAKRMLETAQTVIRN